MAFDAFAIVAPGLEHLALAELRALGVTDAEAERGGVAFSATDARLAAVLVGLRTVTRVIVRGAEFRAVSFAQLQHHARTVPWGRWIAARTPVQLRVTCRKSRLYHSDAVAERLARAIRDAVPTATFVTATRDEDPADQGDDRTQLLIVRVADDVCTISADAAGAPLYMRGYRHAVGKAPLRETLAAAMLLGSEWDATTALVDPLCGSGTIVIEAALVARAIAPGLARTFAAERWPVARASAWTRARESAAARVRDRVEAPLHGSDRDAGAVAAARANATRAGVAADVTFAVAPLSAARAPSPHGLLITNPPYGVRVGDTRDLRDLYARFGTLARTEFAGWRAAMLSADRSPAHTLERQTALAFREAWRATNGGIPVRLVVADAAVPRVKTRSRTSG